MSWENSPAVRVLDAVYAANYRLHELRSVLQSRPEARRASHDVAWTQTTSRPLSVEPIGCYVNLELQNGHRVSWGFRMTAHEDAWFIEASVDFVGDQWEEQTVLNEFSARASSLDTFVSHLAVIVGGLISLAESTDLSEF